MAERTERIGSGRAGRSFRQADIRRAIAGVQSAGLKIAHVLIDRDGRIDIVPRDEADSPAEHDADKNEWDE